MLNALGFVGELSNGLLTSFQQAFEGGGGLQVAQSRNIGARNIDDQIIGIGSELQNQFLVVLQRGCAGLVFAQVDSDHAWRGILRSGPQKIKDFWSSFQF